MTCSDVEFAIDVLCDSSSFGSRAWDSVSLLPIVDTLKRSLELLRQFSLEFYPLSLGETLAKLTEGPCI